MSGVGGTQSITAVAKAGPAPKRRASFGSQVGGNRPRFNIREPKVEANDSASQVNSIFDEEGEGAAAKLLDGDTEGAALDITKLTQEAYRAKHCKMTPAE